MRKYLKKDIRAVFRSHRVGVVPWEKGVDLALFVAVDDGGERVCQPGVGIDAVHFAGLDQRGDDGPVFGTSIMAREEGVFRFKAMGRMVRSTVLLSISMQPSVRKRPWPSRYLAM